MGEIPKNLEQENLDKMETLKEKGIVSFNIELTPEERGVIEEIKIEKELDQFNYYGPANKASLIKDLTEYLGQLEGNTQEVIETISGLVAKIAENTQKDFDQESTWVMVRVTLPNHEFDTPRWHQDGKYVDSNYESKNYKLVFTIKGAPTRFAKITDAQTYQQLEKESMHNDDREKDIEIRKKLALVVQETDPINNDQATLYLVGDNDAKVHSEPPVNTPRIFMSVVPGSPEQIEKFKERYEK